MSEQGYNDFITTDANDETKLHGDNPGFAAEKTIFSIPFTDLIKGILSLLLYLPIHFVNIILDLFKSPQSYEGKICLVTGSGRGLGRELSLELAKLGAKVVCVDIKEDLNNETVKMIEEAGGKAYGYQCNIANYDEVMNLAEKVQQEIGRVYMLLNNAGLVMTHRVGEWAPDEVVAMFNVNVISQYWTIQAFLPSMKKFNEGHIVSIGSISSYGLLPGLSVYAPTKAALANLVKSLQLDLNLNKNNNILISGVYPAVINTNKEVNAMIGRRKIAKYPVEDAAKLIIDRLRYGDTDIFVPLVLRYILPLLSQMKTDLFISVLRGIDASVNVPSKVCKNKMLFNEIKQMCSKQKLSE